MPSNKATYTPTGNTLSVSESPMNNSSLDASMGGTLSTGVAIAAASQVLLLQANLNLAQDYYDRNKTDFDFWASNYQSNMASALAEAMARPLYQNSSTPTEIADYGKLDYEASISRGRSVGARKLDRQWFAARKRINNYGVGMGRWIDYKFGVARLNEDLNGWNVGFRFEDHRMYQYNNQRHAHRTEILNLGIGYGNAARAGLASSVAALGESRAQLASQFGSLANGLAEKGAYDRMTKRLQGPQVSRRQLSTATVARGVDSSSKQIEYMAGVA